LKILTGGGAAAGFFFDSLYNLLPICPMKNIPINVVDGMPEIPKSSWHNQFNDSETLAENPHRKLAQPKEDPNKPKKQGKPINP
jgi:hypothetical protein